MKEKQRFKSERLRRLIFDDTQASRASLNTSGVNVTYSVCRENVSEENEPAKALKGKVTIYE